MATTLHELPRTDPVNIGADIQRTAFGTHPARRLGQLPPYRSEATFREIADVCKSWLIVEEMGGGRRMVGIASRSAGSGCVWDEMYVPYDRRAT